MKELLEQNIVTVVAVGVMLFGYFLLKLWSWHSSVAKQKLIKLAEIAKVKEEEKKRVDILYQALSDIQKAHMRIQRLQTEKKLSDEVIKSWLNRHTGESYSYRRLSLSELQLLEAMLLDGYRG